MKKGYLGDLANLVAHKGSELVDGKMLEDGGTFNCAWVSNFVSGMLNVINHH